MYRILLAEALDAESEAKLDAAGTVVRAPAGDENTLRGLIGGCDALVCRTHNRVTRAVLAAGKRLRVVGVAGVGVDHVDLAAAEELGIRVVNTPGAATDAVADLALAFMLLLQRPLPRMMAAYRDGQFKTARAGAHGRELRELTIGIVGMGRIGSQVGQRCAAGCRARVLYNDIVPVGPFDFPAQAVTAEQLWAESDVVTLHVPLTPLTRGMINAAVLAKLKPGALLVNTARGAVVDTEALTSALQAGRLGGAALDVTDPEPLPPEHPLFACERCYVTPHIAARTYGGLRRMCAVVDSVLEILRAGT